MTPPLLHWPPLLRTILLLLAGCLGPSLGSLVNAWSVPSHAPPALTERLKPSNHASRDLPVTPLAHLLTNPDTFHQQDIVVRGMVTRLELHVDESTLFIDYVFWLKDGEQRVLVFGHHDRTTGDIQMVTGQMVEVHGLFWKERFANGYRLENNLEAQQVKFFPPVKADRA